MITIFRDIIVNEGPANLYRGIASPVLAEAPKRAIKFSANAVCHYRQPKNGQPEILFDNVPQPSLKPSRDMTGKDRTGRIKNLERSDTEPRLWHHSRYRTPTELMPNYLKIRYCFFSR